MAYQFPTYKESLDYFKHITYKTNEYVVNGKKINTTFNPSTQVVHTLVEEGLVYEQQKLENNRARTVVKEEAVQRFSPNNIDNKQFWSDCRELFPLISICGGKSKNIKDVNTLNLGMSETVGILPFLNNLIANSPEKLNVLEIGFGYGSLFFEIKNKCNYLGIDYVIPKSLKRYKNFFEINQSGIPQPFLNKDAFDVVYSVNVLQHCSQRDRFIYFKQAHEALKPGGHFLFTVFLMTENNKNDACWGYVDKKGRGYTQFFNQLTECDWDYELYYVLDNIGFEVVKHGIGGNFYAGIVRKK